MTRCSADALPLAPVRVSEHVYWVGAVDWEVRDFHGYTTPRGTTYNAYLVLGDEPVLIDTVKPAFVDEMLTRLRALVDLADIRYIVSNHSELDHSGGLPRVCELVRPEAIFASANGVKALADHYGAALPSVTAVADGETRTLASLDFTFVESRMLHWPDSMFSWLPADNLLFSNDAFGMHLASSSRFADELDPAVLAWESAKYYANIILPFSPFVTRLGEKLTQLALPIATIAPDHGPIWRKDPGAIVSDYLRWARQERTSRVVIAYDSMWGATARMARAVAEGVARTGAEAVVLPLSGTPRSEVAAHLLDAGALVVGSPTLNGTFFPSLADPLTYVKGLKPRGLLGATFGAYGWSGEATKHLSEFLTGMGVEVIAEPVRARYVPTDDVLCSCRSLGQTVAQRLING